MSEIQRYNATGSEMSVFTTEGREVIRTKRAIKMQEEITNALVNSEAKVTLNQMQNVTGLYNAAALIAGDAPPNVQAAVMKLWAGYANKQQMRQMGLDK